MFRQYHPQPCTHHRTNPLQFLSLQDEAQKKAAGEKAKDGKKTISSVLYELKYDVKSHGYTPKELEKRVAEEVRN